MSLAQRFERRLESVVGTAFARVFKGQVEPVEIGSALQREATDKRNVMPSGEVLAPNRYRITLAPSDYERLVPWEVQLANSLAELVQEHLDENGWRTSGDVEVYLARDDSLHTGVFGVASRMESNAAPRRRPYDSLSIPGIPGHAPGDYQHPFGSAPAPPQFVPGYDPRMHEADPYLGGGPTSSVPAPPMPSPPILPAYPQPAPSAVPDGPYIPPAPYSPGMPAGPPPGQQSTEHFGAMPGMGTGARGVLVIDGTNRRYDLHLGSNFIGRGTESDLQLLDLGVSRRHLDVHFDGNYATANDLGSTNGTSVNGHDVKSQPLRHGDVIRVGHTRLVFQQEHG
jgi:hypothetical protein